MPREVAFEIKALAMGGIVTELEGVEPGAELAIRGFLAPSRLGSRTLLLHITGLDRIPSAGEIAAQTANASRLAGTAR